MGGCSISPYRWRRGCRVIAVGRSALRGSRQCEPSKLTRRRISRTWIAVIKCGLGNGLDSRPSTPDLTCMSRVIIVANRLPVTVNPAGSGVEVQKSTGGLATGLLRPHEQSGGLWIGWAGGLGDELT